MENVVIPKELTNLMFIGDGQSNTIITSNRNVVDGDTPFSSPTVGQLSCLKPCNKLFHTLLNMHNFHSSGSFYFQ